MRIDALTTQSTQIDAVRIETGRIDVGRIETGRIETGRIDVGRIDAACATRRHVRSLVIMATASLLLATGACSYATPCDEDACPASTVCELDGVCRPLSTHGAIRFARATRLDPVDWAVTRSDRAWRADGDEDGLDLGGAPNAVVHLAFPYPEKRDVLQATLTLRPHPTFSGARQPVMVAVHETDPFTGRALARRWEPRTRGAPVVQLPLSPTAEQPIRFDVTPLFEGPRAHRCCVYLTLRAMDHREGLPWRLASPRAVDSRLHPSLELLLR